MNASLLLLSLATAAAAPQDVLYDFYSTHCVPCQMMIPIVERLQAEGYPVVKINIDERPDLMQRFGIQLVPTFVLVVGGQEWERVTGGQEESKLRAMLAQLPRRTQPSPADRPTRRSVPIRLADDESKPKFDFHLPLPPFNSKKTKSDPSKSDPSKSDMVQIDAPNSGPSASAGAGTQLADGSSDRRDWTPSANRRSEIPADSGSTSSGEPDSVARGAAPRYSGEPDAAPDPSSVPMLTSSARIRVTDEGGVYFGSGVVIDGTAGKSVVLTCGHILRDVKPQSQIVVDLFEGRNLRTYKGAIVKFDLSADVGLLILQTTSNVTASPVAGLEDKVARGQTLLSIGCSRGELPSIERLRVTMLNRYEGPDTIECTGIPVKGRSGGGLFTTNGHVVGICTNADPTEGKGVYAGLKPIHDLLRKAGLADLIPGSPQPTRGRMIDVAAAPPAAPAVAVEEQGPSKLELELAGLKQGRAKRTAAEALGEETVTRADADTAVAAAAVAAPTEEAEVICIIRPIRKAGGSKVVIINRASRKFMKYLTGEAKDQLQPTMSQAESAEPTGTDEPRTPQATETVAASTTSAWKPTASTSRFPSR
ncbi:MAG TPA: trypsin-like peptidase domain-containing protein [Planctomycetaceae bacterium]|nr:trypsin-like peptidase domain-containing protein [Planctomycetaceae bacterium]